MNRIAGLVMVSLALSAPARAAELSTLERAYLKELTFLKAEKTELEAQAAREEKETARILERAKGEVAGMTEQLVSLRRDSELAEERIRDAQPAAKERIDVVYDALSRAREMAKEQELPSLPQDRVPSDQELADALSAAFEAAAKQLEAGESVRTEKGAFFGLDGKQIEGSIVKVGEIAAYGVASDAAGALIPAGDGTLRLVPQPAEQGARELAEGRPPAVLPIFVADSFFQQEEPLPDNEPKARTKRDGGIVHALMGLPIFHAEWVLYLLIVLSLLSVGVMVERSLFYRRHAIDIQRVRSTLRELLSDGDYAAAADYLAGYDSFETNVVLFGLREHEKGPDSVEDLIRGAEASEKLRYNRWLGFLATVGSNSPFIGLFGTVLGIIRAFGDLSADMGNASGSVMSGISEALIATAVGLLVAIPAVIAYNAFMGRVKTVLANAELLSKTLLSNLKAHDVPAKGA